MKVLMKTLLFLSLFININADTIHTTNQFTNSSTTEQLQIQIEQIKQENQTKEKIILSIMFLLTGILMVLITFYIQKRKTQEELKAINERYHLAVEGSNTGMWDWDIKSGKVVVTQTWKDMLDISETSEVILYEDWVSWIHPIDKPRVLNGLQNHLEKKSDLFTEKFRLKGADQSWRYIKSVGKVYFDRANKPLRMVGFHMDETEKAKLQNRNKLNETFLQVVFDTQPNITITSYGERIHRVNQAFLNFFSIEKLESFTKDYDCICDRFVEKEGYLSKFTDGELWINYIYQNPHKDHKVIIEQNNELFIFIVKAQKLKYDKKNRHIIVFVDITKLIHQKEIIVKQEKRALMGDMIENIAHQWRQPLSVITVIASGIKARQEVETLSKEDITTYCDNIEENIEYLNDTIDDFKNFYKDEKTILSFSIKNLIEKVVKLYTSKFNKRDIQIIQEIDDIEITGFKSELIQVFMNIFSNAKDVLETIEARRLFFIKVTHNEDLVTITFKDNGGGIPVEIIDKVFDSHFTTKVDKGGTGIGLYMTKQIIEEHFNGIIDVQNKIYQHENNEYCGTEFTIKIQKGK